MVKVVVTVEDDDDDNGTTSSGPRPNAYWAQRREEEGDTKDDSPTTFGGAFRATRPVPHGGTATVAEKDTLGSTELCWCGQPAGHDWPGKAGGRKHPRESRSNAMATHTRTDKTEAPRVGVRDLRAYHADLQEVILLAVNQYGVKYRLANNQIMLYAPDGVTKPIVVHARNTQRQAKALRLWFAANVLGIDDAGNPRNPLIKGAEAIFRDVVAKQDKSDKETAGEIREVAIEELHQLIDSLNDPAEHPKNEKTASSVTEPEPVKVGPWVPYVNREGEAHSLMEMQERPDGTHYRCRECNGSNHEYDSTSVRGIGGHVRMWHRDRLNLHGPEARAMAVETGKVNKITEQVKAAIDLLAETVGYDVTGGAEVEQIKQELDAAASELTKMTESRAEWKARAEDAEAKLALMKEVFGS